MKFYGSLFLLLAMFASAQKFDDNPTGDDIRVPTVVQPVTPVIDDNPSPSDILEGKVNVTVSNIPSVTPKVDDSTFKNNGVNNVLNGMGVIAMILFL